ncbi:peptide deformylase [Campylobacter corcagiensis]|uniref:Peptide deformylase n=1 Tax=Campylobacter corcagiensis TaxID=1448857 RepID=A0A7M1LIN7_9BACT|nr:peptide deformylase [Campylobacter corcagiensis]QKF63982.1 peptide deformylase [Campylobacter corcagiensis]QOQ87814.1 peptide deformylase [Campylobacter corcagiensis]
MILEVLTYPDKRLYEKSLEVTEFDEKLHKFLDDMYETMIAKKGIGLAAIQVGVPKRVLLVNLANEDGIQDKADLLEIINPEILSSDGEICYEEGCLSVPEFFEEVTRPEFIKLKFQDRFGKVCQLDANGLKAVCIQHEIDHLNGHLFIEKISFKNKKRFSKEYKEKLKKQ